MTATDVRPLLPVYLVHFGAPEWCRSAVSSLSASDDLDLDLVVVDNGPPGALDGALDESLVRVLANGANRGYTGGANRAFDDWLAAVPPRPYCVIASHDLHVEPSALRRLYDAAEAHPECGVLGPVITGPRAASGGVYDGVRGYQVGIPATIGGDELIDRDWVSGTCMLIRREAADQIGFLDERFGSYVEDVDYGLRARDAGWRVVTVAGARVCGIGSSSTRSIRHITANTVLLDTKRQGAVGFIRSVSLFGYWVARGSVTGVAPWRAAEERRESRRYARQRLAGLADVVRRAAVLVDARRRPRSTRIIDR